MRTVNNQIGRHRLGRAGSVHCAEIPAVAAELAEHRRNWFNALLNPAKHSFAAIRKSAVVTAAPRWVPATAS